MLIDLPATTRRLVIRRFIEADREDFLSIMLDADSTKYLTFTEEVRKKDGAESMFNDIIASYDGDEPFNTYAIEHTESGRYIGTCGFDPYADGVWECFYIINREYWGRGYAPEAMEGLFTLLPVGFEVCAFCCPKNAASIRVAAKLGMEDRGMAIHVKDKWKGRLFVARM